MDMYQLVVCFVLVTRYRYVSKGCHSPTGCVLCASN